MRFLAACLLIVAASLAFTRNVPSDYATIQVAIDSAVDGDTVLVWPGTYIERIDFLGKNLTVLSLAGPSETTINGDLYPTVNAPYGSVVTFQNGEGRAAIIQGFTITGGSGNSYGGSFHGGGIFCLGASPTIRGNVITGNVLMHYAGDVCCGGGIYCWQGSPLIVANLIVSNCANGDILGEGGGIWCYLGEALIYNNVICGNTANPGSGGGIDCAGPTSGNPFIIANNTISDNASGRGGGIRCSRNIILEDCIVWGNQAVYGGPSIYLESATPNSVLSVDFCDIEGGQSGIVVTPGSTLDWGQGNIDLDPEFTSGPLGSYHLSEATSPCIDGGNPSPASNDFEDTDNPGFPLWPALGLLRNDMGAFGGPLSVFWTLCATGIEWEPAADPFIVAVAPNPAGTYASLSLYLPGPVRTEVSILDISGRTTPVSWEGFLAAGSHSIPLDLTGIPEGLYAVLIRSGNAMRSTRLVIGCR